MIRYVHIPCVSPIFHYCFFNLDSKWRWVVNATPRSLSPQEIDLVIILEEAGLWARRVGQQRRGQRIRSPDHPASSKSLYRLSCLLAHTHPVHCVKYDRSGTRIKYLFHVHTKLWSINISCIFWQNIQPIPYHTVHISQMYLISYVWRNIILKYIKIIHKMLQFSKICYRAHVYRTHT